MKTVYKGNSKKSGIYKIINTKNSRIYIGSAKEFKSRLKHHLYSLRRGTHYNKFLQNDFSKCGEKVYEFHVIEVVAGDEGQRLFIEEKYLEEYYDNQKQCYNLNKKAKCNKRENNWSKTPEETRRKLSEAQKKKWEDPKYRKRQKEIQAIRTKENWRDPKIREKRVAGLKKSASTEEWKEERSRLGKEAWERDNGERREKTSKQFKKMWEDPEYRENKIKSITGRKNTEEQKQRMSEAAYKRIPDSEETKKIKSLAAKKRFQNPEQRALLAEISRNREPFSKKTREKISKANKGRKCSEETKRKISEANKGRRHTEEAKKKNAEAHAKTYNVILISPEGREVELVRNISKFAEEHGLYPSLLNKLVNGKIGHHRKWTLLR